MIWLLGHGRTILDVPSISPWFLLLMELFSCLAMCIGNCLTVVSCSFLLKRGQEGDAIDECNVSCQHNKLVQLMKVVWDAPGLHLYLLWFATNCFPAHSCDARAKDCMHISNVFGFDGAIINGFFSRHFWIEHRRDARSWPEEPCARPWSQGLCAWWNPHSAGDGLNHRHGGCGVHIEVGEATADATSLVVKDNFFAMGVVTFHLSPVW